MAASAAVVAAAGPGGAGFAFAGGVEHAAASRMAADTGKNVAAERSVMGSPAGSRAPGAGRQAASVALVGASAAAAHVRASGARRTSLRSSGLRRWRARHVAEQELGAGVRAL